MKFWTNKILSKRTNVARSCLLTQFSSIYSALVDVLWFFLIIFTDMKTLSRNLIFYFPLFQLNFSFSSFLQWIPFDSGKFSSRVIFTIFNIIWMLCCCSLNHILWWCWRCFISTQALIALINKQPSFARFYLIFICLISTMKNGKLCSDLLCLIIHPVINFIKAENFPSKWRHDKL